MQIVFAGIVSMCRRKLISVLSDSINKSFIFKNKSFILETKSFILETKSFILETKSSVFKNKSFIYRFAKQETIKKCLDRILGDAGKYDGWHDDTLHADKRRFCG